MNSRALTLPRDGGGYADLAHLCLVGVGEGKHGQAMRGLKARSPSRGLLGNKLPSQAFLSPKGREEMEA
jgi:hypothetical protein